ncbi:hypothetical protein AUJ66_01445 [Candidatus Desantisbacteria bacterium CG1_02_38_46]|uniref:Peptidase A2A n=1 Tax=Candidatus Desantisbacteria bacterium CG1_02_38_46 TaxID=1817893 RepID=A0A1J4SFF2_9BACT|nr:MAG: hypothetical protein AUJ66_01445 [Candidatus Desantisbacteria bacterium CG1_02_38_46]
MIIKRVRVEGPKATREVDLILDTGARFTSLSWGTLEDIGYDPAVILGRVKIITANGIIETPIVKIKNLCVGDLCRKDVEVICHDIPEIAEVDGLLGLSFLVHFRTVVDYKEGLLEIS